MFEGFIVISFIGIVGIRIVIVPGIDGLAFAAFRRSCPLTGLQHDDSQTPAVGGQHGCKTGYGCFER